MFRRLFAGVAGLLVLTSVSASAATLQATELRLAKADQTGMVRGVLLAGYNFRPFLKDEQARYPTEEQFRRRDYFPGPDQWILSESYFDGFRVSVRSTSANATPGDDLLQFTSWTNPDPKSWRLRIGYRAAPGTLSGCVDLPGGAPSCHQLVVGTWLCHSLYSYREDWEYHDNNYKCGWHEHVADLRLTSRAPTVPLPASGALAMLGLGVLGAMRRRRR